MPILFSFIELIISTHIFDIGLFCQRIDVVFDF
jgi:hypothetical protein